MPDQLPSSSSNDSIVSMLDKASSGISNEDIKQALSPTMQRQPIQMPSYFTTPRKQVLPGAEMDRREVVGAGNARGRDIGNSVSASVRTLGNFIARRDNQKQMAEAGRVQQLLSAQAGVDQAQELLKTDPNNAAAKESLQHNQTIVQGLFQDPKFVKTVQKGFQVSLTDPSQNKTEHHSIVQKGIDLFKKQSQQPFTQQQAQQMSQKFAASQPTQLAPNQLAVQRLQMMMEQRKDFIGLAKSMLPAIIRGKAQENVEVQRGINELNKQQGANTEWERRNAITQAQLYGRLGYQQQLAFQRLDHENSLIIGRERQRIKDEGNDPNKLLKASDESARTWAGSIAGVQTSLDQAYQTLATYKAGAGAKPEVVQQMQNDIDIRTIELERTRRQASYYKGVYQLLGAKAGLPDQTPSQADAAKDKPNASTQQPDARSDADPTNSNDIGDWANYNVGDPQ